MRIGMILSTPLPPKEGIGFYAWNLARFLVSQGHEVQLITRGKAGPLSVERKEGLTVWRPCYLPIFPFHVHFHYIFVSRLIRRLEHEFDLLHIHSPLSLSPLSSLPILVTVHSPLRANIQAAKTNDFRGMLIRLQAPFSFMVEEALYRRASRVVAVASLVATELRAYGIPSETVSVIGNGVDTEFFIPARTSGGDGDAYFLTVSRLAPGKGLEDLIQAAERVVSLYPSIKFVIAGDGPLRASLHRLIQQHHLEKTVLLIGHVSDRQHLRRWYQNALAYLHPSHYEGLPTALLEAMACGKAVIACAVSGNLDVITHRVNGLLIPPRTPSILAETILQLLENPALCLSLGQEARATVCARYSWAMVGQRYLDEYEALLKAER